MLIFSFCMVPGRVRGWILAVSIVPACADVPADDGFSQGCPAGTLGCPCTPTDACAAPLECIDRTCFAEPTCGNGILEPGEACEDGNIEAADGCEPDCTLSSGAIGLASGASRSCAILWSGGLRCWGAGYAGALGYGTDEEFIGDDETPAWFGDVPLGAPVQSVTLGNSHTCVLLPGGRVRCWGADREGQLGRGDRPIACAQTDGDTCTAETRCCIGDDETAASATDVALGEPASSVFTGGNTTCAVLESGKIRCWGNNVFGQLGNGMGLCPGTDCTAGPTCCIGDDESPASAPGIDLGQAPATMLLAGAATCAVMPDGTMRCWGIPFHRSSRPDECFEQNPPFVEQYRCHAAPHCCLGDDESVFSLPPVELPGAILAGSAMGGTYSSADHSDWNMNLCVVTDTALRCWSPDRWLWLMEDTPLIAAPSAISLTSSTTCGLFAGGGVRCWGENSWGEAGYGFIGRIDHAEAGDLDLGGEAVALSAGYEHTCALLKDRTIRCWGAGALGYGNHDRIGDDETPAGAGPVPVE